MRYVQAVVFFITMGLSATIAQSKPTLLMLPKVIYAAVGIETNIYFESIVPAPEGKSLVFKVTTPRGKQQAERWVFTPQPADVGEFPLTIEVRDTDDNILAVSSAVVKVATMKPGRKISYLAIGDSLTEAGVYTEELREIFRKTAVAQCLLLGTHHSSGPAENVHEGYGGWKYEDFLSRFDPKADAAGGRKGSSPFVHNQSGKPLFDVARYFKEQNGGSMPDAITVFLGTNDIFAATDQTREAVTKNVLTNAETLVSALRKAAPEAKIGILSPLAPAGQDAFGENYGTEYQRWTYQKNQAALLRGLMEKFSSRESSGIYFVPAYLNFDPGSDYPTATAPRNARNSVATLRQNNAVHPAEVGYLHLADAIYAWFANIF